MSPLPILVGVGLLFLVASSGSAKAATPAPVPGPVAKKPYDLGYSAGYLAGLEGKAKSPSASAAAASGDAAQYTKGYADGYAKGVANKPKDAAAIVCVASGMPYSLLSYQQALIAAGSLAAKNAKGAPNADGSCGPLTQAAIKSFQTSQGRTASGTIDKATSDALEPFIPPVHFTTPRIITMVRPSEWEVYGLGSAFIHVGPDLPKGSYRAAFTATPAAETGNYVVETVISNPGGIAIKPGDFGELYTYDASTDSWIYTTAPV